MIITQQSSEMTIASYLTDPSTGGKLHLLPDQPNRLST
jgi:hypothetical protein